MTKVTLSGKYTEYAEHKESALFSRSHAPAWGSKVNEVIDGLSKKLLSY
jgi:hypothetical protein